MQLKIKYGKCGQPVIYQGNSNVFFAFAFFRFSDFPQLVKINYENWNAWRELPHVIRLVNVVGEVLIPHTRSLYIGAGAHKKINPERGHVIAIHVRDTRIYEQYTPL